MKKCNACGHMNDDAQLFCGQCGNKLGDPDPSAQQPIQATQPPTQNEEPAQTTPQPPVDNRTPQQRNYDWYASMKDDSGTKDNGRKAEKKKGKKGVLIGIIVAVVIVVVAFVGILALGGDDESAGSSGDVPAASEKSSISRDDFIASCQEYTYAEIARDPDQYKGKNAKFTGQVIQVQESGNDVVMRVSITKNKYDYGDGTSDVLYDDPIYVEYTRKNDGESRVLEEDIVTMYGTLNGLQTYESILGESISIPLFEAEYIDIQGQS